MHRKPVRLHLSWNDQGHRWLLDESPTTYFCPEGVHRLWIEFTARTPRPCFTPDHILVELSHKPLDGFMQVQLDDDHWLYATERRHVVECLTSSQLLALHKLGVVKIDEVHLDIRFNRYGELLFKAQTFWVRLTEVPHD